MNYLTRPVQSGIRELRLVLSNTSQASQGARQFYNQAYASFKQSNPDVPFLLRTSDAPLPARLRVRGEFGTERVAELDTLSAEACHEKFKAFIGQ